MRLYLVITLLSSILFFNTASANNTPGETEVKLNDAMPPVVMGEVDDFKYTLPAFLWRSSQYMRFRLNKKEKQMHQSAVFFMLENAKNGEIVSWYSDERLANGKVRVIKSYPISGGFCRTYQAYIKLNGAERHMTNNACKYIGSPSWSFYK